MYQGLIACSIVGMVFAGLAAILLIVNAYQIEKVAPAKTEQLLQMQKQFDLQPNHETLAGQIRALDAQIRKDELRRQRFGQTGVIYLVVSLVVGIGSMTAARMMLSPAPAIPTHPICIGQSVQRAMQVRTSTTIVCAVIAAAALFAVL